MHHDLLNKHILHSAKLNVNHKLITEGNERYDLQINNTKICRNQDPEQLHINLAGWDWANYSRIKYGKHYRQLKVHNKSSQDTIIGSQMNYMFPPNMVIIDWLQERNDK